MRKLALPLLLVLVPALASATVIMKLTIEQLTAMTAVVVRGHVIRSEATWDDAHRRISTYTELSITDSIKGQLKGSVMVRSPGGVVGEYGQDVAGAARFERGEDVLLFLFPVPDEPNVYGVESMSAGKVVFKQHLGQLTAMRDLNGLGMYDKSKPKPKIEKVDAVENLGAADAFVARVRKAAGGGAK